MGWEDSEFRVLALGVQNFEFRVSLILGFSDLGLALRFDLWVRGAVSAMVSE